MDLVDSRSITDEDIITQEIEKLKKQNAELKKVIAKLTIEYDRKRKFRILSLLVFASAFCLYFFTRR